MMFRLADSLTEARFNRAFLVLFVTLFAIAPLYYQDNPGGEALFLPFNNTVWIAATFMISLGLMKIIHTRRLLWPELGNTLFIFPILISFMGAVLSVAQPVSWMFRVMAIWGGMLLFLSLSQFQLNRRWQDNLLLVLALSALTQAVIGLLQLTLKGNLGGFIPWSLGVPRGIFQQVNVNASYTATGLVIALYCLTVPSFRRRPLWLQALLYLTIGLCTLIIATSGSRIGLIGALGGILVMLVARLDRIRLQPKRFLITILTVVLAVAGSAAIKSKSGGLAKSFEKFEQMSRTTSDPTRNDVRWMMYDSSLELIMEKPLLGHGIGRFEPVWADKKAEYLRAHPEAAILEPRLSHPHNEILYWAVEGGLLAVSGLLAAAFGVLVQIWRLGRERGVAYLAMLIPITLHTQVELPIYISHLHWLLIMALLALIASHRRRAIALSISRYGRSLGLAICISLPVLATIFFTHTLVAGRINLRWEQSPKKELEPLEYLQRNLFFNDMAAFKQMQTLLNYGLQQNDENVLRAYTIWAEERIRAIPEPPVYIGLSLAYHRLGEYEKSYAIMDKFLSIYPTGEMAALGVRSMNSFEERIGRPPRYRAIQRGGTVSAAQ